jgi:hypothetical protein
MTNSFAKGAGAAVLNCWERTNCLSGEELDELRKAAPPGTEIFRWIQQVGNVGIYDYWIDPKTGEDVNKCPWYRFHRAGCYKTKGAH